MTQPIIRAHGRETEATIFDKYVIKRPKENLGAEARIAWLAKQHKTKNALDEIYNVGNPRYNIPQMHFIEDDKFQLLEDRAYGEPLTADLFNKLTQRQRYEIVDGIAPFLVDMNELKPVEDYKTHKISDEIKFNRLNLFIENKMSKWFKKAEIQTMARIRDMVGTYKYETRRAWSHCDLNPGNVLYDYTTSTISFIDFAEANYNYIYRDIFAPLQIELGIFKQVYEAYYKMHNHERYRIPAITNQSLREIMKFRIMLIALKRFIKASDDLRTNSTNKKTIQNNINKVAFIREQITALTNIELQFSK